MVTGAPRACRTPAERWSPRTRRRFPSRQRCYRVDLERAVLDARRNKVTWNEIGTACGVTRQAAYDRWGEAANRAEEARTKAAEPLDVLDKYDPGGGGEQNRDHHLALRRRQQRQTRTDTGSSRRHLMPRYHRSASKNPPRIRQGVSRNLYATDCLVRFSERKT